MGLIIGREKEGVTWDGERIVDSFPATFRNDFVHVRYYTWKAMANDHAWTYWAVTKTLEITLPDLVTLTANRVGTNAWAVDGFLDAHITLPIPAGGVDGHCGNANGDLADDTQSFFTLEMVRGTWRVDPSDSIFSRQLALASEEVEIVKHMTFASEESNASAAECVHGTMQDGLSLCRGALPNGTSEHWIEACALDVCAVGGSMVNHTLSVSVQVDSIVEQERLRAEGKCHTCNPGDACFADVKWALEVGIPTGYYDTKGWSPVLDSMSCFEDVQSTLRFWQHDPSLSTDIGSMSSPNIPVACHPALEPYQMDNLTNCR